MKKLNLKTIFVIVGVFLIGGGSYVNYLMAQQRMENQMSDLTLANLEAMAFMDPDDPNNPDKEEGGIKIPCRSTGDEYDYCTFLVVTTDGKSKVEMLQGFINDDL